MAFKGVVISTLICILNAVTYHVTINVHYPASKLSRIESLFIRGDNFGLTWNNGISMTQNNTNSDIWNVVITGNLLKSTVFSFKALINDNTWQIGANNMFYFDINNIESDNVILDVFPWFKTTLGEYRVINNIYSPELMNTRNIVVYTPPSYFENTLKYYDKVIIMHDGQNLFNDSTSFAGQAWNIQNTLNQQIYAGNIDEVIIIGIYNTQFRIYEYTYSFDITYNDGGGSDYYTQFVLNTVIPQMKQLYRIPNTLNKYGVIGSSLGGLLSCYIGWSNPDIFYKNGCMSSSFWWNNFDYNTTILQNRYNNNNILPEMIYIDVGSSESNTMLYGADIIKNHLINIGYQLNNNISYYIQPNGQHNEYWWGKRFYKPMQFLYSPQIYNVSD